MTLGTDYILNALAEEGLRHLFMVPGGLVDPFLPALARQDKLKPVVAAHEGGAAYMADGYARASGGFGAAIGIGGPGACNMATAVAAAKTDASTVLVMTGEVPVDMEGRGAFQDASQATLDDTAVMAPLTRLSKTVADAKNLNHWFRHALTIMWAQPRGPVHLSLTHDALTGECDADYVKVGGFFAGPQPLSLGDAERALALLADPKGGARIVILAGAGVEHDAAAARLKELAERWSIPVATTLRAKGVIPEDHDLSLGVFGYAGTRHATSALLGGELDCLLVLGGRRAVRAARPAGRGDHRRRLHADAWPRAADRGALPPADHLLGDQQRRARQCLATRQAIRRPAGGADQHPGSRLGGVRARSARRPSRCASRASSTAPTARRSPPAPPC
jgi:acetolactate synthase I/II/III large subunit